MQVDEYWMCQALDLAQQAAAHNEVPVGAVLVADGEVIARGYNQMISTNDPTAHAEIMALRQACSSQGNYRLSPDCCLYVTLEPCCMCLGALIHARLCRLVFATPEPRAGAVISQLNLLDQTFFNHNISYDHGCLADKSSQLLQAFFQARR